MVTHFFRQDSTSAHRQIFARAVTGVLAVLLEMAGVLVGTIAVKLDAKASALWHSQAAVFELRQSAFHDVVSEHTKVSLVRQGEIRATGDCVHPRRRRNAVFLRRYASPRGSNRSQKPHGASKARSPTSRSVEATLWPSITSLACDDASLQRGAARLCCYSIR
jgi:hypothetical protein